MALRRPADGRVRLRCTPEIEVRHAALRSAKRWSRFTRGDARGNPFAWLSEIECPVRIATAEKSWPIYKEMASRAAALIPAREPMDISNGVDHCVAQEDPKLLLEALKAFEAAS